MKNLVFLLVGLWVFALNGQTLSTTPSLFDHLSGSEMVDVTLSTDLAKLLASQFAEAEYQDASLSYKNVQGETESWELKVKVRGKFRRQACDFPPLKLNFSKDDLSNRGLASFDKLKLVTHCLEDQGAGEELLLREYLAYKIYQEVSPYSFRVQLVRIKYVDSDGALSSIRRYGFIIEDTDEMAARIGGLECDACTYAAPSLIDDQAAQVHAMFQYFIGNADYSLPVQRNVKLVQRVSDGKLIPVGYDFDFSGIVDAPYALPAGNLGQLANRQRIFLGRTASDADMDRTVQHFFARKNRILNRISRFNLLSKPAREDMREYLLTFYDQLAALRASGTQNFYVRLRQEHPNAVPDGGTPSEYGLTDR